MCCHYHHFMDEENMTQRVEVDSRVEIEIDTIGALNHYAKLFSHLVKNM